MKEVSKQDLLIAYWHDSNLEYLPPDIAYLTATGDDA